MVFGAEWVEEAGYIVSGRHLHVVFNPAANKGQKGESEGMVDEVSRLLEDSGASVEWHETEDSGHATEIVGGLPEDANVVVIGGDGTVHEVTSACCGTERVMGIIPAGSGNDYAKPLRIPTDVRRAVDVIVAGNVRVVDMGEVNGEKFNNGLGIGFDAEVAEGVGDAPKWLGGTGRYLWSVGKLLVDFECHEMEMVLEDDTVIKGRTILVAAAIGTTYGARFRLAPAAEVDDGMLDVIWSEDIGRLDVMRILPSAFGDGLLGHDEIHFARARNLKVEFTDEISAHVDGEMLPPTRRFDVKVLPGCLNILAPPVR